MSKNEKLTGPQLDLLTHAIAAGKATCVADYQPAVKLIKLGLVTSHEDRMGGHWVEATSAGIAAFRKATNAA